MTLAELRKVNPDLEKQLRDGAFEKAKDPKRKGWYVCAECGRPYQNRVLFQVDHIKPMSRGGRTVPENLQILCRDCNRKKGDKWE